LRLLPGTTTPLAWTQLARRDPETAPARIQQ